MRYAQIVVGPAGSGKTTYCKAMQEYLVACKRQCYIINLDPATQEGISFDGAKGGSRGNGEGLFDFWALTEPAEFSAFDTDIRDLVDIGQIVAEHDLGPNGALVMAAEVLMRNIDWLAEQIEETYGDESYLLFDTPGQIELLVHIDYVKSIAQLLQRLGINAVAVFLLDVGFVTDSSKLIAGSMAGLAAMVNLQLPHVNLLSKCDLALGNASLWNMFGAHASGDLTGIASRFENVEYDCGDDLQQELEAEFAQGDDGDGGEAKYQRLYDAVNRGPLDLLQSLQRDLPSNFKRLNYALVSLLQDFNLVSFIPLDLGNQESLERVVVITDIALAHGEEAEPRILD